MELWQAWWEAIWQLRPASSRLRSFLWFAAAVAGLTLRSDLFGVTSVVRALGLRAVFYDRLLDFFHSPALHVDTLSRLWAKVILQIHPGIHRINGRLLLIGDGIKVGKSGKKMPAVKSLHQESDSNTKPSFIM